jgi:uncharacterized protein (TIGR03083 family)
LSLTTANDARRVAVLSRAEHANLLAYLEQLPLEGWTEPSACRDWQVYQVVSHLGSQPEIHAAALRSGLRGAPPMTDEERKAIWAHFDSLQPGQVLAEYRRTNGAYIELVDWLTEAELGQKIPWFLGDTPLAGVLAARLNEQTLHSWDIRSVRDPSATLTADNLPTLLDFNQAALGRLAKPERAPTLHGQTIQLLLHEPDEALVLQVGPHGVTTTPGQAASADLTLELPAEAFLRLIWGRLDLAQALASGQARLDRPEAAAELQALFPGR